MIQALDPVNVVRLHPKWFFRSGEFEPATAVHLLVREAELSPSVDKAQAQVQGAWCAVSATGDWLNGDLAPFTSLTYFPEGGINATRVEIVLTAFCGVVATASHGLIQRSTPAGGMPGRMVDRLGDPSCGRVVVFRR